MPKQISKHRQVELLAEQLRRESAKKDAAIQALKMELAEARKSLSKFREPKAGEVWLDTNELEWALLGAEDGSEECFIALNLCSLVKGECSIGTTVDSVNKASFTTYARDFDMTFGAAVTAQEDTPDLDEEPDDGNQTSPYVPSDGYIDYRLYAICIGQSHYKVAEDFDAGLLKGLRVGAQRRVLKTELKSKTASVCAIPVSDYYIVETLATLFDVSVTTVNRMIEFNRFEYHDRLGMPREQLQKICEQRVIPTGTGKTASGGTTVSVESIVASMNNGGKVTVEEPAPVREVPELSESDFDPVVYNPGKPDTIEDYPVMNYDDREVRMIPASHYRKLKRLSGGKMRELRQEGAIEEVASGNRRFIVVPVGQ